MLALDEFGRCCERCGKAVGDSLHSTGLPVVDSGWASTELVAQLEGRTIMLHRDPDECSTGRPAYDALTRLVLVHGQEGVWPAGGPVTARLWCPRRKQPPHEIGRLYAVSAGQVLLCRRQFGRPYVKVGAELIRSSAPDFVIPVLLEDLLAVGDPMLCPDRKPLLVDAPLVGRLTAIGKPPRPLSVSVPWNAVRPE